MTRNQQWILIAIGVLIGAALVVGIIKKKFPDVARGGKPPVENVVTGTGSRPAPVEVPYKGAPPAPRGDYDPKLNQTIQAVTGQLRMLDSAIARAIMRKKLGFEEFEKLHFGGASDANVDPAYAVFNPEGKIKFRPMMGAWIDQAMIDAVTKQKNMHIYYSLRRQTSPSGTTDVLFAVIPSPSDKLCERVPLKYTVKPTLKFAANNGQVVTDEAGAIPNNAMKVASCITSGDGRVYYFHPLRARFLRQGGTMWQGR